jgi:arylformamidase
VGLCTRRSVVRTGVAVTEVAVPGHDHFDLPFGLGDPRHPLGAAVERMMRR